MELTKKEIEALGPSARAQIERELDEGTILSEDGVLPYEKWEDDMDLMRAIKRGVRTSRQRPTPMRKTYGQLVNEGRIVPPHVFLPPDRAPIPISPAVAQPVEKKALKMAIGLLILVVGWLLVMSGSFLTLAAAAIMQFGQWLMRAGKDIRA